MWKAKVNSLICYKSSLLSVGLLISLTYFKHLFLASAFFLSRLCLPSSGLSTPSQARNLNVEISENLIKRKKEGVNKMELVKVAMLNMMLFLYLSISNVRGLYQI